MSLIPKRGTVYVVDDDEAVRDSLQWLLEGKDYRVRCFDSAESFLARYDPREVACLIIDIRMGGMTGLELQERLIERKSPLPVVFITGHGDIPMSVQAMKGGAIEFLTKPFRDQDLLDAIQLGLGRDRDRRAQAQVQALRRARWDSLSPGEQAVVRGVAAGRLNKQIAADLGVSEITVKVRRAQAMRKMQVRTLAELLRLADPFCGTYTAPP